MKKAVWPWPWSYDLKINRDYILSRGNHRSKFSNNPAIKVVYIEKTTFFFKYQQENLNLWLCDLKINRGHRQCNKFCDYPGNRSKDLILHRRLTVLLWPMAMWPENKWGRLFPTGNLCTQLGNFQTKGSKGIERTSFVHRPNV